MDAVLTAAQMSEIDDSAQRDWGIPSLVLMEHAGFALNESLKRHMCACGHTRSGVSRVYVVAGRGNNGGDGLVMARLSAIEGRYGVVIVDAGCTTASSLSQTGIHLASCRALGVPVISGEDLPDALNPGDWIVDAISGTGIRGALRDDKQRLVERLNAIVHGNKPDFDGRTHSTRAFVFSVDVPSGLGDEFRDTFPVLDADVTGTVGWYKRCLLTPAGRRHCGVIELLDIYFPRELNPELPVISCLGESDIATFMPPIAETAHKGIRGHLAIVAGSSGSAGAALLAATAASNARIGLVSLLADASLASGVEGLRPQVMVHASDDPVADISTFARRIDALLIGPGWGTGGKRRQTLSGLIAKTRRGVIDADGLTLLSEMQHGDFASLAEGDWLVTPHPGECARMAGRPVSDVLEFPDSVAAEFAGRYGVTVLLKAAACWIATPDGMLSVFDGAHRAGGVGGSGDVLAGVCGALMTSGLNAAAAASAAVVIHARAVREAFAAYGWFHADTLASSVGGAIATLEMQSFGAEGCNGGRNVP